MHSPRGFCQICLELDHPVFISWDFATVFFCRARPSLASNPPTRDQVSVFVSPPSDRVVQLSPRHWILFWSPSTAHGAMVKIFEPASMWVALRCKD
jgi:hypothetical protein